MPMTPSTAGRFARPAGLLAAGALAVVVSGLAGCSDPTGPPAGGAAPNAPTAPGHPDGKVGKGLQGPNKRTPR